jgi:hypothetical protein
MIHRLDGMLIVLPEVSKSKTPRELTDECVGIAIGECLP